MGVVVAGAGKGLFCFCSWRWGLGLLGEMGGCFTRKSSQCSLSLPVSID